MDPSRSREIPSFSAADLAEIVCLPRLACEYDQYPGVVTFLGRPGRGATQLENLPRLNWATQFLTVEYNGAFPLMLLSQWREFPSAPFFVGKKIYISSRLHLFEIILVAWHASYHF